jgi:NAD(P)-dependent dehydrogenase (short-subunit alcohol dehydrogenase family)
MSMSKVALITGASGGLGQSVANLLVENGWQLVVVGRDLSRLQSVYGHDHLQIEADCSTFQGAAAVMTQVAAAGLLPTALAHCAGNIRLGALHRMSTADVDACIGANLISAIAMLGQFIGHLRQHNQPGSVVLVSSVAAQIGTPNHEVVAAAKGGLEGLARGAAATYAPYGIRVNVVAPGIMDSPATEKILGSEAARAGAAKQYPIPGIGATSELAELMVWLLSEKAARVTAQVWSVDGGFTGIRPLVK